MCLGCSEYTKTTRSHLARYSGIEAAGSGLYRGLAEHHRPEQGSHTWLDIVLNDKTLIKKREVWEAIRGGMGALWKTCLGRNPVARKGGRFVGHGESSDQRRGIRGGKDVELSPLFTHIAQQPTPGLANGLRLGRVFSPSDILE